MDLTSLALDVQQLRGFAPCPDRSRSIAARRNADGTGAARESGAEPLGARC